MLGNNGSRLVMLAEAPLVIEGRLLRALPVRGRDRELQQIADAVSAVAEGRGGVLVIQGPPGIGKTRLLTEGASLAKQAGVRSLTGEAFEYQHMVPFAPLFSATLHAHPPVGDAEALRRLGTRADLRYWVINDLRAAIAGAAAQQPLAIHLEDIHWADNGTLMALRSLTAGLAAAPVLWVLTARSGAGGRAVDDTLGALERAGADILRLAAVSPTAVADIIADVVRVSADDSLLHLAQGAQGNPFLLMELLRGLGEENRVTLGGGRAVATGEALPRRLTIGMQHRLDLLSEEARQLVQVASALPDRFTAELLAAMLDRQPAALIPVMEEAVDADLLAEDGDRLRFRHELLRQATRQSMPQSLRRAMERQSATTMLDAGAAPEEVATQLVRSADIGDQAAIATLREAAHDVAGSDPGAAAELSKSALGLLPAQDPQRGQLVAETIVLLNRAMHYDQARQLAADTLAGTLAPEQEAEIRVSLSTVASGTTQRRIDENRRALALPDISAGLRARHHAWLAYNLMMDGRAGHDRGAANEAAGTAEATGDLEAMIMSEIALAGHDCADGYCQRALARTAKVDMLTRTGSVTAAHQVAAHHRANVLAVVGQLDEAAKIIADGIRVSRSEGNGMTLQVWTHDQGMVHLAAGRLSAARATIECLPIPDRMAWTSVNGALGMLTLADVAVRSEDRTLLNDALVAARDAYSTGSPAVRRGAAGVLAQAAWQRDDVEQALRLLEGDVMLLATPLSPTVLDQVVLTARVAAAAGHRGLRATVMGAADVLERERPRVTLFTAVAEHARGILARDLDAVTAATESLRSSPRPLLYACAAEDAGRELGRMERITEALGQLNVAFDVYTDCGARADARRVGRLLRSFGVERRMVTPQRAKTGWDSLTESELKVVHLVAAGATNNAVAQKLHVSPHTVKAHLRNAYTKLAINSRIQLRQLAGDLGPGETRSG
jgi:DNA-binding CsgD family transcriptional regulator